MAMTICLLQAAWSQPAAAQSALDGFTTGAPGDLVRAIAVQPDGKVLLGGPFAGGITRRNPDGSIDSHFSRERE